MLAATSRDTVAYFADKCCYSTKYFGELVKTETGRTAKSIFEVQVPEAWVGKSVGELDVRRKFGINILGIKRAGKTNVSVTPDTVLSDDITILTMGEYKALQKCFRI